MATSYTLAIQQLYVAYFNRPADPDGLAYWETVAARTRGDLSGVSKDFARSEEYRSKYADMSNNEVVGKIYENLFGRPADTAGQKYWVDLLNSGKVSIDYIVREVSNGARGSDAEIVENRAKAANVFTEALDTPIEVDNYKKATGGELGRAFLARITDDASYNSATSPAELAKTMGPLSEIPVSKFDLTIGADTLTGTSGADQFFAEFAGVKPDGKDASTLTTGDVTDGGAGEDVLNIHVGNGFNEALRGTFKNIETILIDNDGGVLGKAGGAFSAAKFEGAKEIWQMYDAAKITNLAATTTAGFKSVVGKTIAVDADGAVATLALETVKGAAGTNVVAMEVGGSSLNKVVIGGTIARNAGASQDATTALTVTTGQDAKGNALPTLTLTTAFDTVLTTETNAQAGALTKLDAATSTGKITYVGGAAINGIIGGSEADQFTLATELATAVKAATIDGGAGDDILRINVTNAADITGTTVNVKGGAGADDIYLNVTHGDTKDITSTVDGGAGNDIVHLLDGAGAYRFLEATDKLSGGEGTDTLVLKTSSETVGTEEYTKLNAVAFERVKFHNAVTELDASKMAKVTQIELSAESSVVKLAAAQTVITNANVDVIAANYKSDAATATAKNDSSVTANVAVVESVNAEVLAKAVGLTVDAVTADKAIAATLTGDLDLANIVLKSANATKVASVAIDGAELGEGFITLNVTGTGSVTVDNSDGTLRSVNTSGLGGISNKAPINGLNFTGNDALAETISLGSGKDVMVLSSYGSNVDTVSGLRLEADNDGAFAATSDRFTLDLSHLDTSATAFEKVTLTGTLAAALDAAAALAQNALIFTLSGNTYLYVEDEGGALANGAFENTDFVVRLTGTAYNANDLIDLASLSLAHGE